MHDISEFGYNDCVNIQTEYEYDIIVKQRIKNGKKNVQKFQGNLYYFMNDDTMSFVDLSDIRTHNKYARVEQDEKSLDNPWNIIPREYFFTKNAKFV